MEQPEAIDVHERSVPKGGSPQAMDDRLYMQLLVFTGGGETSECAAALAGSGIEGVIYESVHDPRGLALLAMDRDPARLTTNVRSLVNRPPFSPLELRRDLTLLGRTYATGYEPDLADALLERPRRTALNPEWGWAVWYPLRRTPAFAALPGEEQRRILAEHARIGMAYGRQDLAHDIRLACHGLDTEDNEFVIGVVGKSLHPLSHLIQTMRRTRQTSEYIQRMGPFFVGRAVR